MSVFGAFKILEEEPCPVCTEPLKVGQEVYEGTSCNHVFHKKCAKQWMEKGEFTCPICRKPWNRGEYLRLLRRETEAAEQEAEAATKKAEASQKEANEQAAAGQAGLDEIFGPGTLNFEQMVDDANQKAGVPMTTAEADVLAPGELERREHDAREIYFRMIEEKASELGIDLPARPRRILN